VEASAAGPEAAEVAAGARAGRSTLRPGGRTERNRRAVAAAALALLGRGRIDLSPSLVADEAGVSRSTVHRRWPTRSDLLREAMSLHTRTLAISDGGDFDSGVRGLAQRLARFLSDPTEIALTCAMAAHADPDFSTWQIDYYQKLAGDMARPFDRAKERGALASGVDPRLLLEMLVAPMVVRTAVMKQRLSRGFVTALAEHVIQIAKASQPDPGRGRRGRDARRRRGRRGG